MAKSQNLNQNVALLGVLLMILGLASSYWYLVPQLKDARQDLAEEKAKDDGLKDDIETLESAKINLQSAKLSLTQRGVNFDRFRYVFPPTEDVPPLYIQMEQLMGSTPGISGATYQISPPVSEGVGSVRVPFSITATGSYTAVKAFMQNLEINIRPLSISSMSLSQAVLKDKEGRVIGTSTTDFNLNLTGFARSENISPSYSEAAPTASGTPTPASIAP